MQSIKGQLSRRSPLSIGLVVIFAAVMTYFILGVFAATGPATLYTSPGGTQAVTTGQTFTVNVRISTAGNVPVTGAAVYLSYPNSKLQVVGQSYAGSPYTTQLAVSDSGGVLRIDRAAFPMISGGDQLFAQISFKAIASGSAPISFTGSSVVTSGEDDSNILGARGGVTYNIAAPATSSPSSSSGTGTGGAGSGGSSSSSGSKPATGSTGNGSGGSRPSPSGATAGGGSSGGGSTADGGAPASGGQSASGAEAAAVRITVLDLNNKPVAGAQVVMNGQTVKTDKNGVARFNSVPSGSQAVTIKYNGKKTSKTLQVKNTASAQTPQLFKVSVTRDKFNPVLLLVPVIIVAMAGILFVRPWDRKLATVIAKDQGPQIVTSNQPHAAPPETPTGRKLETPGTVYAPTPSDTEKPVRKD